MHGPTYLIFNVPKFGVLAAVGLKIQVLNLIIHVDWYLKTPGRILVQKCTVTA